MAKKSVSKKKKGIDLMDIALGIGILIGGYKLLSSGSSSSSLTQSQIDTIFLSKLGVVSNPAYGAKFNEAWALALMNNSSVFVLDGKNYSAKTGKAI